MIINQNRIVVIVLIVSVFVLVITNILSLRALHSLSMQRGSLPPPDDTLEIKGSASTASLVEAIGGLDSRIDDLCSILRSDRSVNRDTIPDREPLKPEKEPSLEKLEAAINRLVGVIDRCGLSSERNTVLRARYDAMARKGPTGLKTRYPDSKTARNALQLMTYSQILEQFGPPADIYSTDGMTVTWIYPDGDIRFVDGYVSRVFFDD